MNGEGYIKFKAEWTQTPPFPAVQIVALNNWRDEMYQRALIGADDKGIGFGNISQRVAGSRQFLISGSATGRLAKLSGEHYSLVTDFDLDNNTLYCQGPVIASSESMSHAVIYQECPEINGVIHVHHLALWKALLNRAPTTKESAAYGSPEMARSIIELLHQTDLRGRKVFVMAGHREGIFAFGKDLNEAGGIFLELVRGLGKE